MQYKVPQNIGIEDKIVGPLSLRQLIILAVGGGASYILWAIADKIYELNVVEYIVIAIPALIAALAALVKINDITFTRFVLFFLEFNIKPKKRFWDHLGIASLIEPDLKEPEKAEKNEADDRKKNQRKKVNLDTLSQLLDSGGFEHTDEVKHEDIDQVKDNYLVQQAFFGNKKGDDKETMYWRCKETHEARLKALAKQKNLPVKAVAQESAAKPAVKEAKTVLPITAQPKEITRTITVKQNVSAAPEPFNTAKQKIVPPKIVNKETPPAHPAISAKNQDPSPAPVNKTGATKNAIPGVTVVPAKKSSQIPAPHAGQEPSRKPVRKQTHVNNLAKNQPLKFVPKPAATKSPQNNTDQHQAKKNPAEIPIRQQSKSPYLGEIDFAELKKGEIEINLD